MINKIKSIGVAHKDLFVYTFLNYSDKFLTFCLPLAILYITKNQKTYNEIEYILSLANIAIVFLELGMRTYFFYGYSIANNKDEYTQNVNNYFTTLFSIYFFASLLLFPFIYFVNGNASYLLIFIATRSLFLLLTGFYNSYFRLVDTPSAIFKFTIPTNLLSIILIILFTEINIQNGLYPFFLPQMLASIFAIFWFKKHKPFKHIKELYQYLKVALSYSWPIILNVLLITYINNFAKIYAYNKMSAEDMFQLSYLLRISLIIQMMHVSISGYYSKQIFIDKTPGINKRILGLYSIFMSISVLMVLVFVLIFNQIPSLPSVNINSSFIAIIAYTIVWCYQAYFELYLNKYKQTKHILIFSIVSMIFYTAIVWLGFGNTIISLSLIMLGTITVNLIQTSAYLKLFLFRK